MIYYYLKIYCDQHINILHLLELIQRSPVGTGMFEFLFIVVALSLNLPLVTAGRVECGSMKGLEVLLFGSVLPSTAPHTESVRPLPFELSLLMCFMSPLQFHIPEQLSCSKKLEIQRGLFLLFYPFAHQLRLTITRLEKQSWVQVHVLPLGSETSRVILSLCPLSVPQPCPCSCESRFGSTSAPGSLWQSPPCQGAGKEGWKGSPCPRCRKEEG